MTNPAGETVAEDVLTALKRTNEQLAKLVNGTDEDDPATMETARQRVLATRELLASLTPGKAVPGREELARVMCDTFCKCEPGGRSAYDMARQELKDEWLETADAVLVLLGKGMPPSAGPTMADAVCEHCGAMEPDWNAARAFDEQATQAGKAVPSEGEKTLEEAAQIVETVLRDDFQRRTGQTRLLSEAEVFFAKAIRALSHRPTQDKS